MAGHRYGRSDGFLGGGFAVGWVGVAGATTAKMCGCEAGFTTTVWVAGLEPAPEPIPAGGWSQSRSEKPDILSEIPNVCSGQNQRF